MGNRMIREAIHDSDDVNQMTDFQFRLWVNLLVYVDDYGRGDARPAIIKGKCFPLRKRVTESDIDAALRALAGIGCISLYEVDGKSYLYFPKWESYQSIRNKYSKYPAPDAENALAINCMQLQTSADNCSLNKNQNLNMNLNTKVKEFSPPTLDEIKNYAAERNSAVDPVKFYEFYAAGGWKDSKGNPVKNWKQKFLTWESKDGKKQTKKHETSDYGFSKADVFTFGKD